MKNIYALIFSCLLFNLQANDKHEFHISITEIGYNTKEKKLQISIKLFTDDTEKALSVMENKEIKIKSEGTSKQIDSLITKYIQQRFKISVNDKEKSFIFFGQETDLEATWCYFIITDITNIKSITLKNKIFTEIFDDQQNITHIKITGKKQSIIFDKRKIEVTKEF